MHDPRRRALVTGASSGIGAELCKRLAADGYAVWLAARRATELESVAADIRRAGGRAEVVRLDVSDAEATARSVVALDEACDGFDLVVANAGVSVMGRPHKMTWDEQYHGMRVNFLGAAATLLPLVPRMMARGRGHLVGISSLAADLPLPLGAVYGATKAGLTHLLLGLRPALRAKGVHVTVIHPGFIATPLTADRPKSQLPFLMSTERAVRIITRAIERKQALRRFPWPTVLAIRIARLLPRAWREFFIVRLGL